MIFNIFQNIKLLGSNDEAYANLDLNGQTLMPAFVGGHAFSLSMLQTLLVQTYYNPHLLVILKTLIFNYKASNYSEHDQSGHSHLYKACVPSVFHSKRYSQLFLYLLRDESALCIALYRKTDMDINYLVVNPDKNTILQKHDHVFVLAVNEPFTNKRDWQ